ncbi:MAG: hypothetical protein V4692_06730, partial [Bdellovibrionota bacterium]
MKTFVVNSLLSIFCASLIGSHAALADDAQKPKFDVNDVSLLYPRLTNASEVEDFIGFSLNTARGPLFSEEDFGRLLRFSGILTDNPDFKSADYSKWKLFGVRFDPWAKGNPALSKSNVELRLVFQPYVLTPFPQIQDNSIHLIFELPANQSQALIRSFIALKAQNPDVITNGVPLGAHPGLLNLKSKFASDLKKIIIAFAGRGSLRDSTGAFNANRTTWKFVKASLVNGHLVQQPIPFSSAMTMSLSSDSETGKTEMIPRSTAVNHTNSIVDSIGRFSQDGKKGQFFDLSKQEQEDAIEMALKVDNPLKTGATNTDCLSCHQATRALIRVKGASFLGLKDASPGRYAFPAGITPTLKLSIMSGSTYFMRAFGYMDDE